MDSDPERRGTKNGIKTVEVQASAASPPHVKGKLDHGYVYATKHDDQFVHAVDGVVPTAIRTAGAIQCLATGRFGHIIVYALLEKLR